MTPEFEHPGIELGRELQCRGVSAAALSAVIGASHDQVGRIVRGRRGITPAMSVRIGRALGMDATYWSERQIACNVYHTQQRREAEYARIQPLV